MSASDLIEMAPKMGKIDYTYKRGIDGDRQGRGEGREARIMKLTSRPSDAEIVSKQVKVECTNRNRKNECKIEYLLVKKR